MGKYDSTITRVTPLFDFIGSDLNKLNSLLNLINGQVSISEDCLNCLYGPSEASFPPPRSLLIWCINNSDKLKALKVKYPSKPSNTEKMRGALLHGDASTKNQALNLLSEDKLSSNKWYIFEGNTHPDIYIETESAIYVGEAKRTELELTDSTTWLEKRDQLIRHVDSVLDSGKKVYSFFIIDEPKEKTYKLESYKDLHYFQESLPHRSESDVLQAFNSYIGYTTEAVRNFV